MEASNYDKIPLCKHGLYEKVMKVELQPAR
jgi:hypothetical protein